MELPQQIFDYAEATADPRCSPPTSRLLDFSPTVASMTPYSPHVLFYPPPLPPVEAAYGLPQPPQHQSQAEPYYYYFHAASTAPSRQSPDGLSAKPSPPPTGMPMTMPPPPQPPMCYGPYPPCCCCCTQLHYQQHQSLQQPRCSPDHLLFPQQQLPAAAPVPEYILPLVQAPMPPPPQPSQPHPATPVRKATRAAAEQGGHRPAASRRRPAGLTEPPTNSSWVLQDLQQRRRNGYMHNILYKTELCRDVQDRGACPRGRACQFAHSPVELQNPRLHPLYKTAFCYDFKNKGHCPRGERCFHVHEVTELRESSAPTMPHASARAGSGRGGGRHRRYPAAFAGSAGSLKPLPPQDAPDGRSGGRRAGKSATTEMSYRYLMKKLSSTSSKSLPGCNGRRGTVDASNADAAGMDLTSLEVKTRDLCLGADGDGHVGCTPRSAQ